MKTLTIDTAAVWSASVSTFVDGDVFRESNMDLCVDSIADRLGYLKTAVDGKATIAGTNTFTGINTFNTDSAQLNVTGVGDAVFTCGLLDVDCNTVFRDTVTHEAVVTHEAGVSFEDIIGINSTVGSDASGTIADGITCFRVPTLTANRTYGLPAIVAGDNQILIFTRPRTADSFTAGLSTIGVVPVSEAGWIVAIARAGTWVPLMWSSNIASLSTAV